jgi:hypothetical protein
MTTNLGQNRSSNSNAGAARTSTPVATAGVYSGKPAKPQKTAPSHALIAKKAYEIWLAQGQQPGCDQKHWFEAELQLQRA